MSLTMVDYWDRLKPELDAKGIDRVALSRALGVSYQAVKKVADGGAFGSENNLKAARLVGLSPEWLATGKGEKFTAVSRLWEIAEQRPQYSERVPEIDLEDNPDYPAIRRVQFKLSAGASGFGVEYRDGDGAPIVFQKAWYERRGFSPGALFATRVANGSMEPGLYDGDTIVVNTDSNQPKDGVVFAVNYEGELVVKRMVRDAGQWWLSSDNNDQRRYPRKVCDEHVFIVGEIVHKQSERI